MSSITIITGCPGSGKTTLARELAQASESGLHLLSDDFYRYPAHPIAPTEAASKHQNETLLAGVARAASAFFDGGYDVYIDGVIGPWILPALCTQFADSSSVSYALLQCELATALARVRDRQGAGASSAVEHMHRSFAAVADLSDCRVDTEGRSPEEILSEYQHRLAEGAFRLGTRGLS